MEYFLSNAGLKTQTFTTEECMSSSSTFATQKFSSFWMTIIISLNVTPKELKISPRLKFYTSFCTQRHMHMFKNINSGVVSDVSIEGRYGAKCDVLE